MFGVFTDSFRGFIEVRVVLSQYFPLIFRFILAIFCEYYVIFVSFFILYHGNSAFFMNFRGVRKVRARTVPAFFIDFVGLLAIFCEFFHFILWNISFLLVLEIP